MFFPCTYFVCLCRTRGWLVGCTAILRRRVLPSPIYFEIFEETRIYFKLKLLMIVDRTKSLRVLRRKEILEQNLCQCEKFLFVMILKQTGMLLKMERTL